MLTEIVDLHNLLQVGRRPVWKDQAHPFRTDALLHLTGIPTLIHWGKEGPVRRLDSQLEVAHTIEEADRLIVTFLSSH